MTLTASASAHLVFLGTYTRTASKGIYAVRLDHETGALSPPELVATTANPTWITLSSDQKHLYAVSERDTLAVPFSVDLATGKLVPDHVQDSGGKAPCHLAADATGRCLVVSHYHTAIVATLPIHADGSLGAPVTIIPHTGKGVHPTRQEAAHVHSATISPDNRHVIVCDLGLDRVYTYRLDAAQATLTPAATPWVQSAPGAGPRHSAFSTDGKHVFVINELNNTLACYAYEAATGALTPTDTQPTLPADFSGENTTAEVRVHPNGRFVYGSNRGHDSIAVFAFDAAKGKLTALGHSSTGGKSPRNFSLSPDGNWLLAANQNSDTLRVFKVDAGTGLPTATPHAATVPQAVCVLFANGRR
ncbi:MAG: lactonase family protein [Opitutaceae bacterium]|nr:lactonase family protein [Opitutaceae bacterium]